MNKKEKNIIYIGGFELPDKNAAAQRVIGNAKILRKLGYNVILIGVDKSLSVNTTFEKTKSEYEGFTYYTINYPVSTKDWISYISNIKPIYNLARTNPYCIIAYNYPALALYKLYLYCKRKKIILIGDCTEWYEASNGNIIKRAIKVTDTFFRMRFLHPKLNGLIVISRYLNDYYQNKAMKVIQIPPLVDLNMKKWRQPIDRKSDTITLTYVGSPGTGKKDRIDIIIKTLINIYDNFKLDFNFNIIGISNIEYTESFKDKIPSHIEDKIKFKGRISHIEALKEIINSDFEIFIRDINLTNNAGFPTKYVESISCGTPVITNLSSNIDDYFINDKNGIILDYTTTESLFNSLHKALNTNHEKINEMKKYCKSSSIFDYNKYLFQLKEFLNCIEK